MSVDLHFVDTNVLVYLFDADAPAKQEVARRIIVEQADMIVLSIQILSEFYVSVTRKLAVPLSAEAARGEIEDLAMFRIQPIGVRTVKAATLRSETSTLSYWDALVIETATEAGAVRLVTEDLQHGQSFGGLRVVDPFTS